MVDGGVSGGFPVWIVPKTLDYGMVQELVS
jgi:hypothetical protein